MRVHSAPPAIPSINCSSDVKHFCSCDLEFDKKMKKNEPNATQPDAQHLLDLRFTPAQFTLLEKSARPEHLTDVMQIYTDQLLDLGFIYSHEILIEQCIGKSPKQPARMLTYLNVNQNAYAVLTDLYHQQSWVYFTHYFADGRRAITTCQPGALQLEPMRELAGTGDFTLENTGSSTLASQWKKQQNVISAQYPTESALLMDPHQHLEAEREAYRKYTDLLLDCVILRQSDTQMVGFTHTGASSYHAAVTSKSARRPKPKVEEWVGKRGKIPLRPRMNYRNAALAASAAVMAVLVYNIATLSNTSYIASKPPAAALPDEDTATLQTQNTAQTPTTVAVLPNTTVVDSSEKLPTLAVVTETRDPKSIAAVETPADEKPEQFILASEEDEMWRIAVENAEFYLMSNDGDPAPWIRTARKMAAGFSSDDPRLARTYFLAALLERNPAVAEQQYNRALSIQTKSLGLYHAETAQTLEALAWVAEGSRDALEDAITHQRLALNIYRSIFGEQAEDTRAARWKLQYFEDRLAGRRPKSDDNRRLLPALARFAR